MKPKTIRTTSHVAIAMWLLDIFREQVAREANRKPYLVKGEVPVQVYCLVADGYTYDRIRQGKDTCESLSL